MNQYVAEMLYDEVACGSSWYTASLLVDTLPKSHVRRILAAQRLAKRYAHTYGRDWPVEDADLRDGQEAYDLVRYSVPWSEIVEKLSYDSEVEAKGHAEAFATANGRPWPPRSSKGAAAYALRAEEHREWKDISRFLGASESYLIRVAGQYAEEVGLPWPVKLPTPHPGKVPYNERLRTFDTWKSIGARLGFSRGHVQKYARLYAAEHDLPWPLQKETPPDIGRRCYESRRKNYRPWDQVATALGLDMGGNGAYNHAKEYAEREGLRWPLPMPLKNTGEVAYRKRADTQATWAEIGDSLGVCGDHACRAAKQHAEDEGLPWPIHIPDPALAASRNRRDSGQEAYELRSGEHLSWKEIADRLDLNQEWVTRRAREHAQEQGLPWPIVLPGNPEEQAYQLRLSGMSWEQVAEHEGCCTSAAQNRARNYAEATDLPWPPPVRPVRKAGERPKEAYELGYVQKVPWEEVAERLGYASGASASNSARKYARQIGLPVRTRGTYVRDPDRKRKAYEMRRDTSMSWSVISTRLGYRADRSALTAAQAYAVESNLPWPPR